jgi:hypothetical protein
MRSLFLPKYQPKITEISALGVRVEISVIFGWYFERNDDLINSF